MKNQIGKRDMRPRFGWTENLDNDPQMVVETRTAFSTIPVVVIPLVSGLSDERAKVRALVRKHLKT